MKFRYWQYWRWALGLVLGTVALGVGVAWGPGAWQRFQEERDRLEAKKQEQQAEQKARDEWTKANPGKLYDEPGFRQQVFKIPPQVQVRDVWAGENVLLSNGVVLLVQDLLRLYVDPQAQLPEPPAGATLMTLPSRHGVALWSDGRVFAPSARGVSMPPWELDKPRWKRYRYPYERMRPRPDLSLVDTLQDVMAGTSSTSQDFAVILRRNGQVHAFGKDNSFGQLGPQVPGPDGVPGFVINDTVAIAAGARHALALRKDGSVWMWGQDDLPGVVRPIPPEAVRPNPRQIELPPGIVKIAAGARASYALAADGTVWAWGDAQCASLGIVPARDYRGQGIAYVPDYRNRMFPPRQVPGPSDIIDIQAGSSHALALSRDGRVWGWGRNERFKIGFPEVPLTKYYGECEVALVDPNMEPPHVLRGVREVKQIFVSDQMTAYVRNDDTLWFLGVCNLCDVSTFGFGLYFYLAGEWGHTAARGMWCGKVDEVTTLRIAVDRVAAAYLRGRHLEPGNWPMPAQFRSTAEQEFVFGFDAETVAIRKRAGNPPAEKFALRPQTDQSLIWWEALAMGDNVVPEAKRNTFSPKVLPEEDGVFKRTHCPAIEVELQQAIAQAHRYVTEAAKR